MAQMKISEFGEKKVDDFLCFVQSKVVEELDANLYLLGQSRPTAGKA